MTDDELQELRAKLVARRRELLAEGDVDFEPVRTDPSAMADEDAAPLTEMNQVIASRRNKARADELRGIDIAIARIDSAPDDFGYCDECGDDIATRRLEVRPWSRRCVACAEALSPDRSKRRRHATDYLE